MNFVPVIEVLLDTDLYKFTMWQPFLHSFPSNQAVYRFVCRNRPGLSAGASSRLGGGSADRITSARSPSAKTSSAYLASKRYLTSDFIDFLRIFRFQRRYITVSNEGDAARRSSRAVRRSTSWASRSMCCPSSTSSTSGGSASERDRGGSAPALRGEACGSCEAFANETRARHPFEFFGFRNAAALLPRVAGRSRSPRSRERDPAVLQGHQQRAPRAQAATSSAIGTMAHELSADLSGRRRAAAATSSAALENWVQEYPRRPRHRADRRRGDGCLPRTTSTCTSRSCSRACATPIRAIRWSGARRRWSTIASCASTARTQRLVFSDGLDRCRSASALYAHFADRVLVRIRHRDASDATMSASPALNIVDEAYGSCNGQPVAKLSDSPGKTLCAGPDLPRVPAAGVRSTAAEGRAHAQNRAHAAQPDHR